MRNSGIEDKIAAIITLIAVLVGIWSFFLPRGEGGVDPYEEHSLPDD